jgi:hypothetical protein
MPLSPPLNDYPGGLGGGSAARPLALCGFAIVPAMVGLSLLFIHRCRARQQKVEDAYMSDRRGIING